MKEKILINAHIIDPSQNLDEKGSLIIDEKGKIKSIGKNVKRSDASSNAEVIDIKDNILIPGIGNRYLFIAFASCAAQCFSDRAYPM